MRIPRTALKNERTAGYDVRNHIVRRLPLLYTLGFLAKRMPGRGRSLTANAILERYYARFLYGDRCLYELPERGYGQELCLENCQAAGFSLMPSMKTIPLMTSACSGDPFNERQLFDADSISL